jgi:hypothetical protein
MSTLILIFWEGKIYFSWGGSITLACHCIIACCITVTSIHKLYSGSFQSIYTDVRFSEPSVIGASRNLSVFLAQPFFVQNSHATRQLGVKPVTSPSYEATSTTLSKTCLVLRLQFCCPYIITN